MISIISIIETLVKGGGKGRRQTAAALIVSMTFFQFFFCISALSGEPKVDVDETMYLHLDYYGDVSGADVVKGINFHSVKEYTDYGNYIDILNMSTTDKPVIKEGEVTWQAPEKGGLFFFQGSIDPASISVPWKFDVTYKLNGVVSDPENLAGASGLIEIDIDAIPDAGVSEYMKNNFMLFAALPLDMDKVYSIDAPDSQMASIGEYTGVIFEALPGKEGHFVVRLGTESFESTGVLFLMSPATVGDLKEIKDIREIKDKFRDNTNSMMDDVESLMDNVVDISGQLQLTNQMLNELEAGKNQVRASRDTIFTFNDVAIQDLRDLSVVLTPLDGSIRTVQLMINDVNQNLNTLDGDILESANDMRYMSQKLKDLTYTLREVDQLTVREINRDLQNTESKLRAMEGRLVSYVGGRIATASNAIDTRIKNRALSFATEGLSDNQVIVLNSYLQDAGSIDSQDIGEEQVAALSKLLYLSNNGFSYNEIRSILAGRYEPDGSDLEKLKALQALMGGQADLSSYSAKAQQLLTRLKALRDLEEAETEIGKVVTGNEEAKTASDIINSVLDDLEGTESDIAKILTMDFLDDFVSRTASISSQIKEIATDTGAVTYETSYFLNNAQRLAGDMDELVGILNEYYEDVQTAIVNTDNVLLEIQKSTDDFALTLQTVNNVIRSASFNFGNAADAGIAAGRQAIQNVDEMTGNTQKLKESGADLRKTINDELDEQEADNNFLNMDPYARRLSFTSDKNPEPNSLAIICRTKEISIDKKNNPVLDAELKEAQLTPLDRIAEVFRKLWEIICQFLGIG